ncbi:hypothetical protein [Arcticibacter tournemirensis]
MKKYLLLIVALVFAFFVKAQLPNDSLEYRIRPDSLRTGELHLSIHNFNFLRNYEFFNDFQDGYTLYGAQLEPQLVYYAHPKLSVMAGIHLRKDFGGNGIYRTYPLFSIKYQSGNTALINGVLEGNTQHRFIEPLYDFERKITNPVEYGTQVVINKPSLFLDAFINWNNMIYKPSGEQEELFAGGSADITIRQNEKMKLSLPLQVLAFHQGGQIDTIDKPLKTLLNYSTGIKLKLRTGEGFITEFNTENYFVGFKDNSSVNQYPFSDGKALFLNAGVKSRYGSLIVSYWNGNKYISSAGMPIYQSVSNKIGMEGYSENKRELLILRYAYQKELVPHFYLDFRIEPVFDLKSLGSNQMDFYHSLFLVYKQDFRLIKRK